MCMGHARNTHSYAHEEYSSCMTTHIVGPVPPPWCNVPRYDQSLGSDDDANLTYIEAITLVLSGGGEGLR